MPATSAPQLLPYLERLLDGETVEWKTLGEVCLVQRGASPRPIANYLTSSSDGIPWIKIGDTKVGSKYIESTQERITIEGVQRSRQLSAGDFILSNSMSYGRPYILKIDGAIHDGWASLSEISSSILSDYLFYFLSSSKVQMYWERKFNSGSVSNLNADIIKALPIPIPPLRVQARIVEILDKFTQLEAELEAELEARNKQYDFYRNRLLDFAHRDDLKGQVEWKTLGEICEKVCSGGTPLTSHSKYYEGNIPWLRTQDIDWQEIHDTEIKITEEAIANSSAKLIPENCVIVAMYGATAAKACINKIPLTTNQACCNLQIDEKQAHYKYAYYWICNEYERLRAQGEGSQSNLNAKKIKSYPIPLPPLSEQRRIVEILDRFDTLTNSISEGLPREIALRRKQYEYYRDALLRFPPPAPTA